MHMLHSVAGIRGLLAGALSFILLGALGWAAEQQRERVNCFYESDTVAGWDQCSEPSKWEMAARAVYEPLGF